MRSILGESDSSGEFEEQLIEPMTYSFGVNRRRFVQVLGAGLLVTAHLESILAQRGGAPRVGNVAARLHIGQDGIITVLAGKVEGGQGSRAELTQAAAEELKVSPEQVRLILADTALVPDDGLTAGSRTTPSTVPAVRQGAAAAREFLRGLCSERWGVAREAVQVQDGKVTHAASGRSTTYAELAAADDLEKRLQATQVSDVDLTAVREWKVMGKSLARPNGRDLVAGRHQFPSDMRRPGMLYGRVLRPPSYGAKLISLETGAAGALPGVVVVKDGEFAGVAAPSARRAEEALAVMAKGAKWEAAAHPSSGEVFQYLRERVKGGVPKNPHGGGGPEGGKSLRQSYEVAYVQHAPMETRVALAEWNEGKLTVWTGTQNPFGYKRELARAFQVSEDSVHVIVPDFGGGFGGKHTGEAAVEAARLARSAGVPVLLRWTREEEFTWAYFRPAAAMDAEATLDAQGRISAWHFININSGGSAVETPYQVGKSHSRFAGSEAPLRQGSYRVLAATANTFARECFMDELAGLAGRDPLEFRLAHLETARLRAVLEEAAKRFGWAERAREKRPGWGVGLACGTEKGSYVAACAEIALTAQKEIEVRRICEVFECGAIINPDNLLAQVQGCIIMALGPALREEMRFDGGVMRNASFKEYKVPRFGDVPELDIHLLDRPDLASVGAGETPIIPVAPAIANAVRRATGQAVRTMPIRVSA